METEVPNKIVERLKKLMRLQQSAQKIGSEGEANAAAAAISRLLTQYNLSLMDINPEERKESLRVQRTENISFKDTYGLWKRLLMNVICEFNYCKVFLISGQTKMIVVGTEANTSTVIYIYDMLRSIFRKLAPVRYEEFANGKRAVNARDLHAFLESKQEFANWIKNRIEKYGLVENEDYVVFDNSVKNSKGGRPQIEYALTIDAAKELSMVEGNEKGKQARRYFIACEKAVRENTLPPFKQKQPTLSDKMKAATWLIKTLNLNESSKLQLAKTIADPLGLPTPDYTESKGQLLSATELLKRSGFTMSAQTFNAKLIEKGYLITLQRQSSKGVKKFKSLTGKGLEFGENQVNPNNPKETQALYYTSEFSRLLNEVLL